MSRIARKHLRSTRAGRRAGFTLLEILLTVLLSAVLLSSLWGLLGIYSRLFETGQSKAENAQLTAGLLQQISDDLHGAIQDTADAPPNALGPVRRFGLFGSATVLQIDVLQTTWPQPDQAASSTAALAALDQTAVPQAHELRTIRYTFVAPTPDDPVASDARPGLTRQELDFETPYAPGGGADVRERPAPGGAPLGQPAEEKPPDELSLLESLGPDPNDDAITWIPEVASLEFRYFDGAAWSSTWNSIQRRSLPVAVEVLLDFKTDDRPAQPGAAKAPAADETTDLLALDEASTRPTGTRPSRLVVYFPTSILAQEQAETVRFWGPEPWLPEPTPDADMELEALASNVEDPTYDEAGNLELARAFRNITRGRSASRRRPPPDEPGARRPLIDQPAPDEWMRAGPMSR